MLSLCPGRLVAVVMPLLCASAFAQSDPGQPMGGQPVKIVKDSAAGRVVAKVYDGRYGYVRIETREPNAPLNQQPVAIEPAALRALLTRVQLPASHDEALFDSAELDEIVAPLAQALARALPEQDVSFAVSGRHGALGVVAKRAVTTARVFFAEDRMNLIFGLVRVDWESQFRATGYLIAFEPGKRASMVDRSTHVAAAGAVARRSDWLVLDPLVPAVAATPAQPATPPPAVVIPPAPAAAPAAGTSAPTTQPAPAAPAPAEADAIYRTVAERLKALQKLRDAGLISEEEYQQKRREILKGL